MICHYFKGSLHTVVVVVLVVLVHSLVGIFNGVDHETTKSSSLVLFVAGFVPAPKPLIVPANNKENFGKKEKNLVLFMVSQKDKKRRIEATKKTERFQELEIIKAQNELFSQLKELQKFEEENTTTKTSKNKKVKGGIAGAAKKILKTARHDGLEDIGWDSRLMALEMFYATNRPSDVVDLLREFVASSSSSVAEQTKTPKDNTDHHLLMNQFGLWAYSELEDWKAAVPYAVNLYVNNSSKTSAAAAAPSSPIMDSPPFSTTEEQGKLRQSAILAFANTDQHIEMATKLLLTQAFDNNDESSSSATRGINAILQSHLRKGNIQDAKNLFQMIRGESKKQQHLNEESYELVLDCAARDGDTELMEQILEDIDKFDVLQQTSESLIHSRILETLAKASSSGRKLSSTQQSLAVETIQSLHHQNKTKKKKKKDNSKGKLGGIGHEILSQLLVSLDDDEDVTKVLQCYYNKKTPSWYIPLSIDAKIRILHPHYFLELANNNGDYKLGGDAWKMFLSLLPTDKKSGAITKETHRFLQKQESTNFCRAALFLSECESQLELQKAIIQECCETILVGTLPFDAVDFTMTAIRRLKKESLRIEIFNRTINNMVWGEEVDEGSSFDNPKLDLIVRQTVRSMLSFTDMPNKELARMLAVCFAKAGMHLIENLEEFSAEYFWEHGASDNGAKEALQSIMKGLLRTGLISKGDDLVEPAIEYYIALAGVAQSSSVIDYDELFFSISAAQVLRQNQNVYQEFADLIEGGKKQKKTSGNFVLDALVTLSEIGDNKDGLEPLLQLILEMSRQSQARTGINYNSQFIKAYQDMLFNWRQDLFFDHRLVYRLCTSMFQVHELEGIVARYGNGRTLDDAPGFWSMLRGDFPRVMIKRLSRRQDVNKWIIQKMGKEDIDVKLQVSAKFLVNLYAMAGVFYKIDSEENPGSLGEKYVDACGLNTGAIVRFCVGVEDLVGDPNSAASGFGEKGRGKKTGFRKKKHFSSKLDKDSWLHVVKAMLLQISQVIPDYDELEWSPSFDMLVRHSLNVFTNYYPDDIYGEDLIRVLTELLSDGKLNPRIRGTVRDWRDEYSEEENDS